MSLGVFWDGAEVGRLERTGERTREYVFRYAPDATRSVSLSLPLRAEPFTAAESRPFFEALLPEGTLRERIADQLKVAASDSYGLLAALGRDCAGALQVVETKRMSEPPAVRWLSPAELDTLITELPRRPLGVRPEDGRMRLSLAGVQNKAVLARDRDGVFGEPLSGFPSTHILKPDLPDSAYHALATNEYFCMRLAAMCDLPAASVELLSLADRACLAVERFDRDLNEWPPTRTHQEDLCQALALTPDFKYQKADWALPSYRALADLLDEHSTQPGADRLAGAEAALFHFLVGNADAHAKNVGLLHHAEGVRLAPMYDAVCTAAYPELSTELALAVGDELNPEKITIVHWGDLAFDFRLNLAAFERLRKQLAESVAEQSRRLAEIASAEGWHEPVVDRICGVIAERAERVI